MGTSQSLKRFFARPLIAPFIPKFLTCLLSGYSRQTFFKDLIAGLSVGVLALPLAMAFAIAAGLDPEYGLYTACIAGFLSSFFGGTLFSIGGPTGGYILIIYGIYQTYGYEGVQIAAIEAALLLILMGLFKMGNIIRFIPHPVVIGFTGGIAIVILVSQIKDFFGLAIPVHSIDPLERLKEIYRYCHTISWSSFLVGSLTLATVFFMRKISRNLPAFLIAIIVATVFSCLAPVSITTVQNKFGPIPSEFPPLVLPDFDLDLIRKVFPDAISLALIGAIESLLTAVVADSLTGATHLSNCELMAQGIANIGSSLFHGIPAAGGVGRTIANIHLGAMTPVAGMIHAVFLLGIVMFCSPYIGLIPLPALSAVLFFISWNMFEAQHMRELLRQTRLEACIMLTTLAVTVLVNLNTAVELGVLLSIALFVHRSREIGKGKLITTLSEYKELQHQPADDMHRPALPKDVAIYELEGPFFFAVSDTLNDVLLQFDRFPKTLILRMRSVPFVDASGIQALKRFYSLCTSKQIDMYLSEIRPRVRTLFERAHMFDVVPKERIAKNITDILQLHAKASEKRVEEQLQRH